MNPEKEKILKKIAKILNLARDREGTPEGDLAMRRATEMMAKYRISEAEVDVQGENISIAEVRCPEDKGGWRQWIVDIGASLAHTFDCKIIIYRKPFSIQYLGTQSDVDTCKYLHHAVVNHIETEAWRTWPNLRNWRKRNEVGNVAARIVWERLAEIKKRMVTETRSMGAGTTALVVKKDSMIEKWFREWMEKQNVKFRNLRSRSRKVVSKKSVEAGKRAGQTAPLNTPLEHNQQSAIN